jgi:hypothetical protein
LTAFLPLSPMKAIEMIEAAGVPHARRLLRDHAAAGLVKSYAMLIETVQVGGEKTSIRGGAISSGLWQRTVREGVDADVWTGGTVHLTGSVLIGGAPTVSITGIGFHKGDVQRLIAQQSGQPAQAKPEPSPNGVALPPSSFESDVRDSPKPAAKRERRTADPFVIKPGALLLTIKETQAALGIGRTKVNELMNDGRLVRRVIDGGVRIEVASVQAVAGIHC